jgi:hypothetical protein
LTRILVGELSVALGVLLCGRCCLHAFSGVYEAEMNDRSFEDYEKTSNEIKSLFFNTLYLWTADLFSPLVISYHNFHVLFAPTS